jgi:hypothetical protein
VVHAVADIVIETQSSFDEVMIEAFQNSARKYLFFAHLPQYVASEPPRKASGA